MPPKGWTSVSIRKELFKDLSDLGKVLNPSRSPADTIGYLYNAYRIDKGYAAFRHFKGLDLFTTKKSETPSEPK